MGLIENYGSASSSHSNPYKKDVQVFQCCNQFHKRCISILNCQSIPVKATVNAVVFLSNATSKVIMKLNLAKTDTNNETLFLH
jgi:hypothetical protein